MEFKKGDVMRVDRGAYDQTANIVNGNTNFELEECLMPPYLYGFFTIGSSDEYVYLLNYFGIRKESVDKQREHLKEFSSIMKIMNEEEKKKVVYS